MLSLKEIAWLAGIVEGEGHIGSSPIIITIGMTDRDIIERVAQLFGRGTILERKQKGGYKDVYTVSAFGYTAAGWLMTIYPFLGERRREVAKRALTWWKSVKVHKLRGTFRPAGCHPERMYHANNLCNVCYKKVEYYKYRRVSKPKIKEFIPNIIS